MTERRIAKLASAFELPGEEPWHVMVRSERNRTRVRLERLHEHAARSVAATPSRELGQQLKRSFFGAKVREPEARVGVDDRRERDAGEVVSFRDHLRADEDGALRRRKASERRRERPRFLDRVRVEPDVFELR